MKTIINLKADKAVKEGAQKVAEELGVPLSIVINSFLKEFIRNKQVVLSAIPRMTPYLEDVIGSAYLDIKKGKNLSKKFDDVDEAISYLESL